MFTTNYNKKLEFLKDELLDGKSILITGRAGSGKTYVLDKLMEHMKDNSDKNIKFISNSQDFKDFIKTGDCDVLFIEDIRDYIPEHSDKLLDVMNKKSAVYTIQTLRHSTAVEMIENSLDNLKYSKKAKRNLLENVDYLIECEKAGIYKDDFRISLFRYNSKKAAFFMMTLDDINKEISKKGSDLIE